MSGEAREKWMHGINRTLEGKKYREQEFERVSLTVRHVIDSRRKVTAYQVKEMLLD